ncbi:ATP-binding cassette, subfamily B [Eubacterium ruminantium]|uniref:ATP-binding cassette, subfamily B n=1 Tax=Eubacterium ruminantium TaxID=42322 RepID=A0A1T4KNW9_9FIRM|nr:ABC transporter ATP-binding protein [Eubacterium ruminantium]SCW33577.1 ATP-binding cassette, subfamily B [Eubacterium ruminantium]SDM31193.1 ATP-binding cassette, subfamily B [Eubacterium ruminantium]SJZ44058.1 ATP-binding cassette, subfamily B [Eubacterium ruminantium]
MINKLKHKYALSTQGAKDMIKACISVTVTNITMMMPAGILYSLIKDLLDNTLTRGKIPFYAIGSAVVLILIALTNFIQYNTTFLTTYRESGVRRTTIAEKLRKLPLSYFGKKNITDLTTNIMGDCALLETASSHWIPELIGGVISVCIVGTSLFFAFDFRMVLASFWVIPVAFIIIISCSGLEKKAVRKNAAVILDMNDGIQECLESMRDLRANNAEDRYMEELDGKIKHVEKMALFTELKMAIFVNSASIILKLGIGTTAVVGGSLFAKGEISLLTFFMFLMLVARLYDPMQISLQNFAAIISCDIQSERLDEILSTKIQTGTEDLNNKSYDIVFDHVAFSYSDDARVLKDVSFRAKQGQVTALIGPSGGGKTTISRLAARFWDINDGRITLGGKDISKIEPETLLKNYSIVFQDVTLFNNSVMENIRIGKEGATDEEVIRAAKLANCEQFIEQLPDKYNTFIGENGSELSGGERQRISIARAFLKDAPVILLDEATASLDAENETVIQEALSRLIKNKTVLIIAHRMRTIANADHIVVLKNGVVAEQGSPKFLDGYDSIYKNMKKQQMISENWRM